jgi:pteridine reductase
MMADENRPPVALITGSGRRRVGNVVALALAQRGYAIGLHYHMSAESAQATVAELRARGTACAAFQADVGDETAVDRLFAGVLEQFGRLDVLVTTASIWETIPLDQVTAADLRRNFDANTLGTFLCARRAGLIMAGQETGGAIITIGDWAIERPYLDHSAYFVSKGTIPTLTRVLAVELGHRNPKVRVNCIHPGPVMFPPDASDAERQEMVESTLVRTADCPESIALAVQFLIDNPFVTGVCLPVDGGRTIYAGETRRRSRPI